MASKQRSRTPVGKYQPRPAGVTTNSPAEHPIITARRTLVEANQLRRSGDLQRSLKLYRKLLRRHPDYVAALHEIGIAQMADRDYEAALSSFVRAIMLNPIDWRTLASLAQCYTQQNALEMAARTMEQAKVINQTDAEIHFTLGAIYEKQREYQLAAASFRQALAQDPQHIGAANLLGSCLVHLGELGDAAKEFYRAHLADPLDIGPIGASANLPAGVSLIDVDKAMQSVQRDPALDHDSNLVREAFANANTFDKQKNYGEAWAQLMLANGLINKTLQPQIEQRKQYRCRISELRKQAFASIRPAANVPELPISLFILGISRSGKTTVERIVGHLPGVKRGYENPIVEVATKRASQQAGLLTVGSILELPFELGVDAANIYISELRKRAADAKVFTNTHPGRLVDVGSLVQLVPNAKFLFVYRDREDTALRILMKQYREGTNVYGYSVEDTLAEIDWYHGMMREWHSVLGDNSRIVRYEELVEDASLLNGVMQELCGLELDAPPVQQVPDDRFCSKPYHEYMQMEVCGQAV